MIESPFDPEFQSRTGLGALWRKRDTRVTPEERAFLIREIRKIGEGLADCTQVTHDSKLPQKSKGASGMGDTQSGTSDTERGDQARVNEAMLSRALARAISALHTIRELDSFGLLDEIDIDAMLDRALHEIHSELGRE